MFWLILKVLVVAFNCPLRIDFVFAMGSSSSRSRAFGSLDPKARKTAAMAAGAGAEVDTDTAPDYRETSFIDAWRYEAKKAGLENFAGSYTGEQKKMFQRIYDHLHRADIIGKLTDRACRGKDTQITIELDTRMAYNGPTYHPELSKQEYVMIVTIAIRHIMENQSIKIQDYDLSFHCSDDEHSWYGKNGKRYTVHFCIGDTPTKEDVDRCREYTYMSNGTYRPMKKEDIKSQRDLVLFECMAKQKMDRRAHFGKKAFERVMDRETEKVLKPEYIDKAEPFTGDDDDYDVLFQHKKVSRKYFGRRKERDPTEEVMLPWSDEERKADAASQGPRGNTNR